jgi:exodeoxyribonuclease VII small subunit
VTLIAGVGFDEIEVESGGAIVAEQKFEKDLKKLEKLVEALEEGGLSLDDSLKKFEEGIKLAKRCENALNAAEKKIEVLTKNPDGEVVARPLETGGEEEDRQDDEEDGELLF